MVTILQVVPRLDAGGSELATIEIAQALFRAGAVALVATEGGRMAEEIGKAGGEIVTLPVASKSPFTMIANIGRLAAPDRRTGCRSRPCAESRAGLERVSRRAADSQAFRHHLSRRLWRGRPVQGDL